MPVETRSLVAVSVIELQEFGCPYCGYRSGYMPMSSGGSAVWTCGSEGCRKTSCILAEGLTKSTIGFGNIYPELQDHPRRGIPSHGRADKKPDGGGEFFRSRGIGLDVTPGCFVCGGESGLHDNIAAFVESKEAGERVVSMFARGAKLDYRDFEPDRVQVKLGACNKHLQNLNTLDRLTQSGVLTEAYIDEARA